MSSQLHESVHSVMEDYCNLLHEELPDRVYGVYLYGSTALGHHNRQRSDIDFFTVLHRLDDESLIRIQTVHERLLKLNRCGHKLEGEYAQLHHIPKAQRSLWYRYTSEGKYQWEEMSNHITWYQLKHHGLTIYGHDVSTLPIEVDRNDIVDITKRNINGYWAKQAQRDPEAFDGSKADVMVEFGVLSLCRICVTLETGDMVTKEAAAKAMLAKLPMQWHPIVNEAMRVRECKGESLMYSPRELIVETQAFIRYMSERCLSYMK
ncbi:aminoglycoside adenylyltransferase domain-containing protein [Paenibacillus sp. UNC451MF]|uniref:aminoglycoside adenylyltransferase domain-containing protein n=1 Tax=Paenibacillus sp. UNC451MF TaxID=1449063 RepID=UPI00048AC1DF|nr:aminoglycoside adenylyltransferase domain-containing protein [Paenibacillus sp. UNC451MF]